MADRIIRDENDAGVTRRDMDMGDGSYAERQVGVDLPGTPGFYRGRQFRSFYEFSTVSGTHIPAGQRVNFRFVLPTSILLESIELSIDDGHVRASSHVGGTPAGAFVTSLPIIQANGMTGTPAYAAQTLITATVAGASPGVGITGSTVRDVVRVKTPAGGGASQSETSAIDSVRGLPGGGAILYILVENLGAGSVEGTMRLRWEEPAFDL